MKTKILISLLVIFFISSCEKEEISSQLFEETNSYKATPPVFSKKLSKADYELYSQEMFSLAREVVIYAESWGINSHFLEWDNYAWETITSAYLWQNHYNDYDTLLNTFTLFFEEWNSGTVSVEYEPWQIDVLNEIEGNLNDIDDESFYSESMIYLDEVFDSVYALQGVPLAELDQTLSSIMIIKGSIEFVYENTDLSRGPWGWKTILKCIAGTAGGYLGGGVIGMGSGAAAVGALVAAGVATGGAAIPIIIGASIVGAVGGAINGSFVGGCWSN